MRIGYGYKIVDKVRNDRHVDAFGAYQHKSEQESEHKPWQKSVKLHVYCAEYHCGNNCGKYLLPH